jgi:hypothetical protein
LRKFRFPQPVIDFLSHGIQQGILCKMDGALLVAMVYGNIVSCVKLHIDDTLRMTRQRLQQAM